MPLAILIIHILSCLWTVLVLRSAIVSLHRTGKTPEEIQNVKKGYSFIQRLFLVNVKDASAGTPKLNSYRKGIEKFLGGYIIATLVMWILIVFSIVFEGMVPFVSVLVIAKTVLVDIVLIAFYLKNNIVINKENKTIQWKWEVKK